MGTPIKSFRLTGDRWPISFLPMLSPWIEGKLMLDFSPAARCRSAMTWEIFTNSVAVSTCPSHALMLAFSPAVRCKGFQKPARGPGFSPELSGKMLTLTAYNTNKMNKYNSGRGWGLQLFVGARGFYPGSARFTSTGHRALQQQWFYRSMIDLI